MVGRFKDPLLVFSWLAIIVAGLCFAVDFEKRPALISEQLKVWPKESRLQRNENGLTLLMFVHPNCPCSQASIAELARFMNKNRNLSGYVCFLIPKNVDGSWLESKNWQDARKIPGLVSAPDYSESEAEKFFARGSGETFLFAKDGKLLFHGGITAARGHEGPNSGLDSLQLAVQRMENKETVYPVYGCSLQNCSKAEAVR